MQCRVHNLLGLPQLGRHAFDLAILVLDEQILCVVETCLAGEEGSMAHKMSAHASLVSTIAREKKIWKAPNSAHT